MGVRCSLFGCDYGDSEIERDREERGSEVVMTVREYEVCARCGDRRVISENTGVTSLAAETATDDSGDPAGTIADAGDDSDVEDPGTSTADDGASTDEGASTPTDDGGAEVLEEDPSPAATPEPDGRPGEAAPTASADASTTGEADDRATDEIDPDDEAQILDGDDAGGGPDERSEPGSADDAGGSPAVGDPASVIEEAEDGRTADDPGSVGGDGHPEPGDWPDHEADRRDGERSPGSDDGTASDRDDDAVILDETAEETFDSHVGEEPVEGSDTPAWPGADGEPTTDESRVQAGARTAATDPDHPEDDATIVDGADARTGGRSSSGGAGAEDGAGDWPDVGRTGGEWPDPGTGGDDGRGDPTDHGDWPSGAGEDRGWDATTDDAGGEVAVPGLTPGAADDGGSREAADDAPDRSGAESRAGSDDAPGRGSTPGQTGTATGGARGTGSTGGGPSGTGTGVALTCSACSHAISTDRTPHAAGDICPECAGGYLVGE